MVTTVGTESDAETLVRNLITLEYDAIAAYESTIERLDDQGRKAQIETFRGDHLQHLERLKSFAAKLGIDAPEGGDIKQMLTTGKIALADLAGDRAILMAMKTNEDDTVTAYEQAAGNANADPEMRIMFESAMADEKRHWAWMESESA